MANKVKEVTITCDGVLAADPDPVEVSIPDQEHLVWKSKGGCCAFDVEFSPGKTPFKGHKFRADKGNSVCAGEALAGTGGGKEYKYTVKVAGYKDLDPTVRPTP